MRNFFVGLLIIFFSITAIAQNNSDVQLSNRLGEYMKLTKELRFEEIMEYTPPRMFTIASKEQLIEAFKQAFDNEGMAIRIDSAAVTGISDGFKFENVLYKKIDYSMNLAVRFKDTASLAEESFIDMMKMAFANAFPEAIVEFNHTEKTFRIKASNLMIGIKDNEASPIDVPWLRKEKYRTAKTALSQRSYRAF